MSKIFLMTAAAAAFASVAAFAQTDKPGAAPDTTASAPAASPDSSAPAGDEGKKHHHHHGMRSAKNGTDWDADKLNACMSNATPTEQQESCLKGAEHS